MNWDDLRFFLALAREGTMSGAGRVLKVKHTTVARRITLLEQRLGNRLFDRLPGHYQMTTAAEMLFRRSLMVEETIQIADREVFGFNEKLKGSLKLTVPYDVLSRLITPSLPEFSRAYPEIDLEIDTSMRLVDLASREADIAVRISAAPPEGLIGKKVLPLNFGIYASGEYLACPRQREQLVLWRAESEPPLWVKEHFPQAEVAVRVNEFMTMLELVKQHLGIALMPCYLGDAEPGLQRLDLPLVSSSWGIWVLSHTDLRFTARAKACREFLSVAIRRNGETASI